MGKTLNSNNGLTLVEVLAAMTIVSIISLTIYSVLFGGLKTYSRVIEETQLRDEANYIIAQLISEFYTLKASEINLDRSSLGTNESNNYYLVKKNNQKLGIINSEIIINDKPVTLMNNNIAISNTSTITALGPTLFEIQLVLEHQESKKKMAFSSTLTIVEDRREDST